MTKLSLVQDLAVVLMAAGISAAVFHWRGWPKVIGYIAAGILMGLPAVRPYFLSNPESVNILANLGIIFLMFTLGLDLQIRKLKKIALTVFPAAVFDLLVMLGIGYCLGRYLFHWGQIPSFFFGAVLCDSSTTLLAKSLEEMGCMRKYFASLIFGITISEDILTIGLMALLSGLAMTGLFQPKELTAQFAWLALFLASVMLFGFILLPRILNRLSKMKDDETLLIIVLGICFFLSFWAEHLQFSLALGAFLVGAVVAESEVKFRIRNISFSLRSVFSAVFFVTIGMMVDLPTLWADKWTILLISLVVLAGKTLNNFAATYLLGQKAGDALTVGVGLAQLGDFSYLVALLGMTLCPQEDTYLRMYQIAIGVSVITTLINPLLLKNTPAFCQWLTPHLPHFLCNLSNGYTLWAQSITSNIQESGENRKKIKRGLFFYLLDLALGGIILFLIHQLENFNLLWNTFPPAIVRYRRFILLGIAFLLFAPFFYASIINGRNLGRTLGKAAMGRLANEKLKRLIGKITRKICYVVLLVLSTAFSLSMVYGLYLKGSELSLRIFLILLACLLLFLAFFINSRKKMRILINEARESLENVLKDQEPDQVEEYGIENPSDKANRYHVVVPENSCVIGHKLSELRLRNRTGISILTITHTNGIRISYPGGYDILQQGDTLMVSAEPEQLVSLRKLLQLDELPEEESGNDLSAILTLLQENSRRIHLSEEKIMQGAILKELNLRFHTGASVTLIQRKSGEKILNPGPDDYLLPGDFIMLKGTREQLDKAEQFLQGLG